MQAKMLEDFRLRIFVTAADCGSFTLAAGRLGISQPAVSLCIKELEQLVGHRIFVRTHSCLSLTREGEALLSYARRILYLYDRIEQEVVRGTEAPASPALELADGTRASVSVEDKTIVVKFLDQ